MNFRDLAKRGVLSAVMVVGGLGAGMFGQELLAARGVPAPEEEWVGLMREHSDSAYDAAMRRFGGRVSPHVQAAVGTLRKPHTVLVAITAADLMTCEDLGRQLRELRRAVPDEPGWGMAVLIDDAGRPELERFLRREHVSRVTVLGGGTGALLAGAEHPGTPAALVLDSGGRIHAGVSHPLRVRNTRSRSFAQELGLSGAAGTDLTTVGARSLP
jgi:hypothetical protein